MKSNVCKKCGKALPEGYADSRCEACRNRQAGKIRGGLKVVGAFLLTVAGAAFSSMLKGNNGGSNKA